MSDGSGGGEAAGGVADLIGGGAGAGGGEGDAAAAAAAAAAGGEGGAGGGEGGQGGGADPDWLGQFSANADGADPSNRDWLKSKGFKDLDAVAKSYREAEKGLRDGGRFKVPGEGATPEEVTAYRKAIGVPDDAKGYEIKAPNGPDGKPIALNQPLMDRLADAAAKSGIPKGAFEATVSEYIAAQLDEAATSDKALNDEAAAKLAEWGDKSGAKQAAINTAARALGLTGADLKGLRQAWGSGKALEKMALLGEGMAEDVLMGGGGNRFGVSAAEARKELDGLKADADWVAKAAKKGTPENGRFERLKGAIAAGMDQQQAAA